MPGRKYSITGGKIRRLWHTPVPKMFKFELIGITKQLKETPFSGYVLGAHLSGGVGGGGTHRPLDKLFRKSFQITFKKFSAKARPLKIPNVMCAIGLCSQQQ